MASRSNREQMIAVLGAQHRTRQQMTEKIRRGQTVTPREEAAIAQAKTTPARAGRN